jgi:hypothetical protein
LVYFAMGQPRTLLLFDPRVVPHSWNERMEPGEYAVLYSSHELAPDEVSGAPYCTVFETLAAAKEGVHEAVERSTALRCRIYSDLGLGGPPLLEVRGANYRGESEMSAGFRRWCGSILFFGGLGLIVLDWTSDFKLTWPATLGFRMLPVGLILLMTEAVVLYGTRRKTGSGQMPAL